MLENTPFPQNELELLVLVAISIGCFIIGWLFSYLYYSRKNNKDLENCYEENQRLKFLYTEKGNDQNIRATKSRERRGALASQSPTPNYQVEDLDWEKIGKGNPEQRDDLKIINGVGPFNEEKLHNFGIYSFEQLSRLSEEDVEKLDHLLAFFPGRIKREDWIEQAKKLAKKS